MTVFCSVFQTITSFSLILLSIQLFIKRLVKIESKKINKGVFNKNTFIHLLFNSISFSKVKPEQDDPAPVLRVRVICCYARVL